mgnify:CR=1|jgi:hypothetical protein
MLPFRRFKRDAYMLDQCATMVEGTVHEIGEYVNKDEDMTDSMIFLGRVPRPLWSWVNAFLFH